MAPRGLYFGSLIWGGWIVAQGCAEPSPEGTVPTRTLRATTLDAGEQQSAPACETSAPSPRVADAGMGLGFDCDIYPLYVRHCGPCHTERGPFHEIAHPNQAIAYADSLEFAERIVARIEQGTMPPACLNDSLACVPAEDLALIQRWLEVGAPR